MLLALESWKYTVNILCLSLKHAQKEETKYTSSLAGQPLKTQPWPIKLISIYPRMGYSPLAIHSKCPSETFLSDDERSARMGFLKHVVCGPLATDQGKCHILFELLFSVLFLNLCALVVHMYLVVCILRVRVHQFCCCCFSSQNQDIQNRQA